MSADANPPPGPDDVTLSMGASSDAPTLPSDSGVAGATPHPGPPGTMDGYEIVAPLGEGGMGLVYHAIDREGGGPVAIKTLRPQLAMSPDAVGRFVREGQHMRDLDHPHIVPVLHIHEGPGVPYFVMPLMSGGSLRHRINDQGAIPPEDVVALALQVGGALAHAHRHAVFHRDLKPSNVLIDPAGDAYLADFGLLRQFFDESMVQPGPQSRAGTPAYMSPKAAAGEPETTGGDIYAFGAMLYEMVSGRSPYSGVSAEDVMDQVVAGPPAALAEVKPDAPPGLVRVVEGAMARELRDRYAEMDDVLADLDRIKEGEEPLGPHGQLAARQNRWVLPLALVVTAVVALGVTAVLVFRPNPSGPPPAEQGPPQPALVEGPTLIEPATGVRLSAATLVDWAGDGAVQPVLPIGRGLRVWGLDGQAPRDIPLGDHAWSKLTVSPPLDLDRDDRLEFLVALESPAEKQSLLSIVSPEGEALRHIEVPPIRYRNEATGEEAFTVVKFRAVAPLGTEGDWQLVVAHDDGGSQGPRSLASYDLQTLAPLWSFQIAPSTLGCVFMDLDADGHRDLVVGTHSHASGLVLQAGTDHETDDAVAYLVGLSGDPDQAPDARALWLHDVNTLYRSAFSGHEPFPQYFHTTEPLLRDLDGDGEEELYALVNADLNFGPTTGSIHRIAPATGLPVRTYNVNAHIVDHLEVDLDADGKQELILTDVRGRIHILDHNLELKAGQPPIDFAPTDQSLSYVHFAGLVQSTEGETRLALYGMEVYHESATSPRIDAGPRGQTSRHNIRVMLVDTRFEVLATHVVAETWDAGDNPGLAVHVVDPDRDGQQELLVLTDRGYLLETEQ